MRRKLIQFLLLLTTLLSVSCSAATPSTSPAPKTASPSSSPLVLAYFTSNQESYNSLLAYSGYLDIVSLDVFNVQDDGSIVQYDDYGVPQYDQALGLQTYACLSNYRGEPLYDFDPDLARAAIQTHKEEVIAQLEEIALDERYSGINIDLESIAFSDDIQADRTAFTAFIHELAGRLHMLDKKLIISVPAKSADSPQDTWAYPYDLAALGQAADYLQLMTYDQHGPWGEPGPVAGLDWVQACTAYAVSQVDPAKLLLGLPAYAYDWDLSASDADAGDYSASDLYWADIPDLLSKPGVQTYRDGAAQSPYLTYTEAGHEHVVWYEDVESIRAKVQLLAKYDLGGLAVWALGQEDESFWEAAAGSFTGSNSD
jgi:spore germination protein